MFREEVRAVAHKSIPPGYKVTYHENRGYDSPDRWYEATFRKRSLGSFGTLQAVIDACVGHMHARKRKAKTKR